MNTEAQAIVMATRRAIWGTRLFVTAYVALAVVFTVVEPVNDAKFVTFGGLRYWLATGMALLMSLASLYLAVLAIVSLRQRLFPAPAIPVIYPTLQRRGSSAIWAAVICLLGAASLLILPVFFLWGSVMLL